MTGNIKALLDLHISVKYLIVSKLALFHDASPPPPHTNIYTQKQPKRQCGDLTPGGGVG